MRIQTLGCRLPVKGSTSQVPTPLASCGFRGHCLKGTHLEAGADRRGDLCGMMPAGEEDRFSHFNLSCPHDQLFGFDQGTCPQFSHL